MPTGVRGVVLALAAAVTAAGPPNAITAETPDALVVTVAGWAGWGLAVMTLAATALAVLAAGRGRAARTAEVVLKRCPRCLRTAAVALAAGAALGTTAVPAAAAPATGTPVHHHAGRPPSGPLDWPGLTEPVTTVLVRPGDCLWSITARSLGARATPQRIAAAWPRWWSTNRMVIGADPSVLVPGERLRAPLALDGRTSR